MNIKKQDITNIKKKYSIFNNIGKKISSNN